MNLQRLLHYIQNNHDQVITLDELAVLSGYSPYHFQRLFKAEYGIGPGRLGALLRLHRGYYLLRYRPWLSVLEVAIECGYSSSDGFSRAFKRIAGCTPSNVRQQGEAIPEPLSKLLNKYIKETTMTDTPSVETVNLTEIKVCVLRHKGNPRALPGTLQEFISWRRENRLPPGKFRTFNFLWHDPASVSPSEYIFDLACEIPARELTNTADKQFVSIPQGRYARVVVKGTDSLIESSIDYLLNNYLVENNEQAGDFPLIIERIKFYPEVPHHQAECNVFLLLK
ncbi:MAG: AraC family transcriptional regulator [Alteromonadaceae bacterium]|nr:AraC family transcriptional regulator [Alteromonadaceae bacterium]